MLQQIINRLKSILAKAIIYKICDEGGRQFCLISVLSGETKKDVERIQEFGFTSVPMPGATAVVGFFASDRGRPFVFGTNDPLYRKKDMVPGESAIYDAHSQHIYLKSDGSIEIVSGGDLVIKSADRVRIESDRFEVTGDVVDQVDNTDISMREMRETYNAHTHTGDDGGSTSVPHQKMEAVQ